MLIADWELIFLDDSLLVVYKPAGLLSVPGRGADKQDCLSVRVNKEFPDALVVHRLDMATSGLIIFARGIEMQRCLSQMFRERKIEKRYEAVVAGQLDPLIGEVNLPIIADWPNRPLQKVDLEQGKPSFTRYSLLRTVADMSYVDLEPVTGRSHQLRVHMAAIGHPILGDALYGGREGERLLLHAKLLSFIHPLSGEPVKLMCDVPF